MLSIFKKKKKHPEGLVPRIRPAWWFESYNFNTCAMCEAEPKDFFGISDVFYVNYEADLAIGFCLDQGKTVSIVRQCDIKEWGLSFAELLKIAKENLLKRQPYFNKIREGVWASTLSNTCDSGLMLFKDEILKLDLAGNPIVFFLSRDCLLVTGSNDQAGIFCCMDVMLDPNENYITAITYTLVDGKWQSVENHELINNDKRMLLNEKEYNTNEVVGNLIDNYKRMLFDEKEYKTNEFLESLEVLCYTKDSATSKIGVGHKNENYFTYATWIETELNWIPRVDRIILGPWNNRNSNEEQIANMLEELTFDWDIVAQVCATNMNQLDFFHEIWEFQGFPTDAEIIKMKRLKVERDPSE